MPKKIHDLANKLKKRKGVDNPFALATYIVKKQERKS